MTNSRFRLKKTERDSCLERVSAFPFASIRSDEHLRAAQAVIDELLATGELDDGEDMYLDALSDLVAAYEDVHHAIEPSSDADMLRHLLEAKDVTQAELSRETGLAKSSISEVLAGKKPFSRQMIRKLAGYFNVDVSVLATNLCFLGQSSEGWGRVSSFQFWRGTLSSCVAFRTAKTENWTPDPRRPSAR